MAVSCLLASAALARGPQQPQLYGRLGAAGSSSAPAVWCSASWPAVTVTFGLCDFKGEVPPAMAPRRPNPQTKIYQASKACGGALAICPHSKRWQ